MSDPWWGIPLLTASTTIAGGVVTFLGSWLAESRRLSHGDKVEDDRFNKQQEVRHAELAEERRRQGRDAALAFIASLNIYRGTLHSDTPNAPSRLIDVEEKLAGVQGSCSATLANMALKVYAVALELSAKMSELTSGINSEVSNLMRTLTIAQQGLLNQYRTQVGLERAAEFPTLQSSAGTSTDDSA